MDINKKIALDAIDGKEAFFTSISDKIWEYAELSLKEFKSAEEYHKRFFQLQIQAHKEVFRA